MSAEPIHADNVAQSEYWNASAGQRWTDYQEHQDQVLRPISDRLIAAAAPKPGHRVIDVGCGCGATTIDFATRVSPGGEVLGLDVSEPMLARARERAPQMAQDSASGLALELIALVTPLPAVGGPVPGEILEHDPMAQERRITEENRGGGQGARRESAARAGA